MLCFCLVPNRLFFFTVEIVIHGTGLNKHRYAAVKKIKKLPEKKLSILQRKAALYLVEVSDNTHIRVIQIYI